MDSLVSQHLSDGRGSPGVSNQTTGTFHMPVLTLINITHAIWKEMLDSFLSGIFIMWVCGRACALAPVWRSEDNLLEFLLFYRWVL